MKLEHKNIVITGATSGIGQELLEHFKSFEGTKIIAAGRRIEAIQADPKITAFRCDTSKKEDIDQLFEFALQKFGKIDVFIANAGFSYYERLEKADWEHIQYLIDTNVISPIYALEKMHELHSESAEYNVTITSSAMGLVALPGYSLYSASKFALRGFAQAYRHEKRPNAHLTTVYPIATKTEFFKRAANNAPIPFPQQKVETVAKAIINGIRQNKRSVFPSSLFKIAYYFFKVFPVFEKIYLANEKRKFRRFLHQ